MFDSSPSRTYVVISGNSPGVGDSAKKFKLPDKLANNMAVATAYIRKYLHDALIMCIPLETLEFLYEIKELPYMVVEVVENDVKLLVTAVTADDEETYTEISDNQDNQIEKLTVGDFYKKLGGDDPTADDEEADG